jgi:hypothetical protein
MELWLDQAQRCYLLSDEPYCVVPLRRKKGMKDFYEKLERFLRYHPLIRVRSYREVREGRVWISRPKELAIDWACLLNYRPHLEMLRKELQDWRQATGEFGLEEFVNDHYLECIRDPAITKSCIQVFKHLVQRPEDSKWSLPRQIPHSESTKLVGKEGLLLKIFSYWRGEESQWTDFFNRFRILRRTADFRIFAPRCKLQSFPIINFHGLMAQDWASEFSFEGLKQTLIVENHQTFHLLSVEAKDTLLISGGGWKVSQLTPFHKILPRPLYYWGDIDKEGYEIFGFLRERIAGLTPLLMDEATVSKYQNLSTSKEPFYGPFKQIPDLQTSYELVCKEGRMLEQEKLPPSALPIQL